MIRFMLASFAVLAFLAQTAFAQLAVTPLTIKSDEASHAFTVEIAATEEEIRQGLMFRESLAADAGMLFDFGEVRPASMWMKNTLIPLDMLFIARDGKVRTIKENAEPLSEAIIDSKGPIDYVLELNSGTVKRLGIRTGNRVQNELIDSLRKAQ